MNGKSAGNSHLKDEMAGTLMDVETRVLCRSFPNGIHVGGYVIDHHGISVEFELELKLQKFLASLVFVYI